jgi:hypothetical protein
MNGSLPRSAGATGSAPDLADGHEYGSDWRSSPVTNVWTNHSNPSSAHYTSYNGNSTGGVSLATNTVLGIPTISDSLYRIVSARRSP